MTRPPGPRPKLLEPSRLEPVEIDLGLVFRGGTLVWLGALLVTGTLTALGALHGDAVPICAAGVALGLLALAWERRRSRRLSRGSADGDARARTQG